MKLACTWCCILALTTAAIAEPPHVIAAIPDHGDTGVDPATTTIRIEFDQDMSPAGRSVCGGGSTFPALNGEPRWETPRILLIPVKLEPDHAYDLSINCPSGQAFRSATGESAEITPISFKTGKAGSHPPAALTPDANTAAIAKLRTALASRYSYRDRVVKDWDALIDAHVETLTHCTSRAAFARESGRILASAQDIHIWLMVGDARVSAARFTATPNVNAALLPGAVPGFKVQNRFISTGRFDDGIAYIAINGLPNKPELLEPAHAAFEAMKDAPAFILDLRANGGGDESAARKFASHFIRDKTLYSKCRLRDPDKPGGWSAPIDRSIAGSGGRAYSGRVAVLMGPGCVSSCESFILMLRHGAKATLVGARSWGSSGNPKPHDLGNGVTVLLPSWEDQDIDGAILEGRGIQPDMPIEFVGQDRDEVLEAALAALRTATGK